MLDSEGYAGLRCSKCYGLKPDFIPYCERQGGKCDIEELATDPVLEEFITDFLTAKALYTYSEDPKTQASTFERWGLYDSPQTLLELEMIYAQWKHQEKEKKH